MDKQGDFYVPPPFRIVLATTVNVDLYNSQISVYKERLLTTF